MVNIPPAGALLRLRSYDSVPQMEQYYAVVISAIKNPGGFQDTRLALLIMLYPQGLIVVML